MKPLQAQGATTAVQNTAVWLNPEMNDAASALRDGPLGLKTGVPVLEELAFERLWSAFMTARVSISLALLFVHGAIAALLRSPAVGWVIPLCSAYLGLTILVRLKRIVRRNGSPFRLQWLSTIAVDVLVFSALELLQAGNINYTALFALPVLLASVLGSLRLAIATAATVTLLLLFNAWWLGVANQADFTSHFLQAGLTGAACFMLALLVHQLAARLALQERQARHSDLAVRLQRQVNELVIETLGDGVLVVDAVGLVRIANPAARHLLGPGDNAPSAPFHLGAHAGWSSLKALAEQTFARSGDQRAELNIHHGNETPRQLQVRTRLTATPTEASENLCVMFLQDQRQMEARLRTEKLAAMGRMSTAVAHEIRNPLAAIAQANELLAEDLREPAQLRLSLMVRQNAQRLGKIVEDVLDLARVKQEQRGVSAARLKLDDAIETVCADWGQQSGHGQRLQTDLQAPGLSVRFDPEHLRRVLINLLDNAQRFAPTAAGAIQVQTSVSLSGRGMLKLWSAGEPLEKSVREHLFEPFFSSESRSSGLGLYICRELCERHQAVISYQRTNRKRLGSGEDEGNEFSVAFLSEQTSKIEPMVAARHAGAA